jgi:hypothetical protein
LAAGFGAAAADSTDDHDPPSTLATFARRRYARLPPRFSRSATQRSFALGTMRPRANPNCSTSFAPLHCAVLLPLESAPVLKAQAQITAVEAQIAAVEDQVAKLEVLIAAAHDAKEVEALRTKENLLRTKENLLRTKENLLRTEKKDLLAKETHVRETHARCFSVPQFH